MRANLLALSCLIVGLAVPALLRAEEVQGTRPADARQGPDPATKRKQEVFQPRFGPASLDLGGELLMLGGSANPQIPLRGIASTDFVSHGAGPAFKLHYDFQLTDLDWRVGLNGALPGYLGLGGTVGIQKDVGPWDNPRFLLRVGGGLEMMLAAGAPLYRFIVPLVVGDAELGLEYEVIPGRLNLGGLFDLGVRYGIPLGFGLDLGAFLRCRLFF